MKLLNKAWIIVVIFLFTASLAGQDSSRVFKHLFKTDIFRLLTYNIPKEIISFDLTYEYNLNNKNTISLNTHYYSINLDSYDSINHYNGYEVEDVLDRIHFFAINAYIKYYLINNKKIFPRGAYISFGISSKNYFGKAEVNSFQIIDDDVGELYNYRINFSGFRLGLNLGIGTQVYLGRVPIEFQILGGYGYVLDNSDIEYLHSESNTIEDIILLEPYFIELRLNIGLGYE